VAERGEMKSFRSYLVAGVGFAMLVTIIFLATGWGSAVAAQITSVFVTNDAAHAVPVREQALDGNNIRVHEEGTANVKSADQTQSVFSGTLTIEHDTGSLDVSAFREIRVISTCNEGSLQSSTLDVLTSTGQSEVRIDRINQNCPSVVTRTYEIPGTSVRMRNVSDLLGETSDIDVAVFGRGN
jgi:hypothetical protein